MTEAGLMPSGQHKEKQQEQGQRCFNEYVRSVSETGDVRIGEPLPLGVRQRGDGANFAIFSRHATRVWLELYDNPGDDTPARRIELTPEHHRTGDVWHVWVKGVCPGQLYAYRMDGPYAPQQGLRFNRHKLLLDPSATAISGQAHWDFRPAIGCDSHSFDDAPSFSTLDDAAAMPKCVFAQEHFDWEGDYPLRHAWTDMIIYEVHVRGFTIHHTAAVAHPGTFRGMIEKIPYLRELGVTAVELLPVTEFNEYELERVNPRTGERLRNYWGYNPVAFMAPKASYASSGGLGHQTLEFKQMVKAYHQAGIEVILDIVLNHTAEGNELGPTLSFRGIENSIYYMLSEDRRHYRNYTGTGNTVNANHPVVRDYILDVLRYWTMEFHIDGFRFDLASVLGRDEQGRLLHNAPLLERIAEDPILREVKIIAEAWDAAGAYQVGSFSEKRWSEWNGRYRDDVRRFWRGDPGMLGAFAWRICGSADLYKHSGKGPENSINFVACHDGFTLNDLVSYRWKHNEANGEGNRDGLDDNFSENYGVEGETDDPAIESVRRRQIKNFLLTLFISRGVPMLLGGDEFRRTQRGNNNAYCQDNEISWFDWQLLEKQQEIFRFVRGMIAFRRSHSVLRREAFYTDDEIKWFDPRGNIPDWADPQAKQLACLVLNKSKPDLYLMFNADAQPVSFTLPALPAGEEWRLSVDTSLPFPQDFRKAGQEEALGNKEIYTLPGRSSAILLIGTTKG